MTGLRAKAIAAFEKHTEERKSEAVVHFKKDFGVLPDETGYLGDNRFLFRVDDLYIRGYIEYLFGKSYQLSAPCPRCGKPIVDEKVFFDLAGLGEAINEHRDMSGCDSCVIGMD